MDQWQEGKNYLSILWKNLCANLIFAYLICKPYLCVSLDNVCEVFQVGCWTRLRNSASMTWKSINCLREKMILFLKPGREEEEIQAQLLAVLREEQETSSRRSLTCRSWTWLRPGGIYDCDWGLVWCEDETPLRESWIVNFVEVLMFGRLWWQQNG